MSGMEENPDLTTFTIRKYHESSWGFRNLGPYRYAFDFGHISFLFEFWIWR